MFVEVVLVLDYLEGTETLPFVIVHFDDLSEGAPADGFEQLIPVSDVIVEHVLVFVLFVVEVGTAGGLHFVRTVPDEINLLKVEYLFALEVC